MKKIISLMGAAAVLAAMPMSVSAYDYERFITDYEAPDLYSIHREYKIGTFSDESSPYNGCDRYTLYKEEAYPDIPLIQVRYDYLVVPDSVIGSWFPKKSMPKKYDVKLPLHTEYYLDNSGNLCDVHSYVLTVISKEAPYIAVKSDAETLPIDMERAREYIPELTAKSVGKDRDGSYVYYITTGAIGALESEVSHILTEQEAAGIIKFADEHLKSLNFRSFFESRNLPLAEYPSYPDSIFEQAAGVYTAHGISFTTQQESLSTRIIPDEPVPPLEYFAILDELCAMEIYPDIIYYEDSAASQSVDVEMFAALYGDANCDGKVTIADSAAVLQYLANSDKYRLSAQGRYNIDSDFDGITTTDARKIMLSAVN